MYDITIKKDLRKLMLNYISTNCQCKKIKNLLKDFYRAYKLIHNKPLQTAVSIPQIDTETTRIPV